MKICAQLYVACCVVSIGKNFLSRIDFQRQILMTMYFIKRTIFGCIIVQINLEKVLIIGIMELTVRKESGRKSAYLSKTS